MAQRSLARSRTMVLDRAANPTEWRRWSWPGAWRERGRSNCATACQRVQACRGCPPGPLTRHLPRRHVWQAMVAVKDRAATLAARAGEAVAAVGRPMGRARPASRRVEAAATIRPDSRQAPPPRERSGGAGGNAARKLAVAVAENSIGGERATSDAVAKLGVSSTRPSAKPAKGEGGRHTLLTSRPAARAL